MKRLAILIPLAAAALGCGGGYDAEYDCEQTVACQEAILDQEAPASTVETCIDNSEALYDDLSDDLQDLLDDAFESCESETSCAYVACVCDEFGIDNQQCADARRQGS